MAKQLRSKLDPFEHDIEKALAPGEFISDHGCYAFVDDLDCVETKIAELIPSDPARAVALHEAFLAGCYQKVEELDDSSGSFGDFVMELFCGWIKARQAAGADPNDTVALLLARIDEDPYGFLYRADVDAAAVLDKAGLAAFEKQIRARFEATPAAKPAPPGSRGADPAYARRRWGEALRALYLAQKSVQAYIAIANETGLAAKDCHVIATMLGSRRKLDDALTWVERGIDINKTATFSSTLSCDLPKLKREILTKLGRGGEALEFAWAAYKKQPSKYTYDDLMKLVPKPERSTWHAKAIESAQGANIHSLIELLLETKEMERLAGVVRQSKDAVLEGLSHHTIEPAAKKLEKSHPDAAARLWRAQGMRIVNAKKSKSYDAALSNFTHSMRCFEKAGLAGEWQKTVTQVRAEHHLKTGFLAGFEELASGSMPNDKPSFLERAKSRWGNSRT